MLHKHFGAILLKFKEEAGHSSLNDHQVVEGELFLLLNLDIESLLQVFKCFLLGKQLLFNFFALFVLHFEEEVNSVWVFFFQLHLHESCQIQVLLFVEFWVLKHRFCQDIKVFLRLLSIFAEAVVDFKHQFVGFVGDKVFTTVVTTANIHLINI